MLYIWLDFPRDTQGLGRKMCLFCPPRHHLKQGMRIPFGFIGLASVLFAVSGVILLTAAQALPGGLILITAAALALGRHWTITAAAAAQALLLGAFALGTPAIPLAAGAAVLAGFVLLMPELRAAYRQGRDVETVIRLSTMGSLRENLEGHRTAEGLPLNTLVDRTPALLVFLRHTGCTFCRQTLSDLSQAAPELARRGIEVVLVHQSSEASLNGLLQRYGLADLHVVHDERRVLYRRFGLETGSVWRVANPWVVLKSVWSVLVERHGMHRPDGDPLQMPGAFFVSQEKLLNGYWHRNSSDRPDYLGLCPLPVRARRNIHPQ
jgi:hypothetical protein